MTKFKPGDIVAWNDCQGRHIIGIVGKDFQIDLAMNYKEEGGLWWYDNLLDDDDWRDVKLATAKDVATFCRKLFAYIEASHEYERNLFDSNVKAMDEIAKKSIAQFLVWRRERREAMKNPLPF